MLAPGDGLGGALAHGGVAAQLSQEGADLGGDFTVPGLIPCANHHVAKGGNVAAEVAVEVPALGVGGVELNVVVFHQSGVAAAEVAVLLIRDRGEYGGPVVAAHKLGVAGQIAQHAAAGFAEAHDDGVEIALGASVFPEGHFVTGGHGLHQQPGRQGYIGKNLHIPIAEALGGAGEAAVHAFVGAAQDEPDPGGIHTGFLQGGQELRGIEPVPVFVGIQGIQGQLGGTLFTAQAFQEFEVRIQGGQIRAHQAPGGVDGGLTGGVGLAAHIDDVVNAAGHQAAAELHGVVADAKDDHGAAVTLEPELQPLQRGGAQGGDGGAGGGIESHHMNDPECRLPDAVGEKGSIADGGVFIDARVHPAHGQHRAQNSLGGVGEGIAEANAIENQTANSGDCAAGSDKPPGKSGLGGEIQNHRAKQQGRKQYDGNSHWQHLPFSVHTL